MVVRVEDQVWRKVVLELGAIADVILIDVSIPSLHIAWEVDRMEAIAPGRTAFICREGWDARQTGPDIETPSENLVDESLLTFYSPERLEEFEATLRGIFQRCASAGLD